jgi:hypothetical protein
MKKYAIIHLRDADSLCLNRQNQGGCAVASGEDPFTQLKIYSGITKEEKGITKPKNATKI